MTCTCAYASFCPLQLKLCSAQVPATVSNSDSDLLNPRVNETHKILGLKKSAQQKNNWKFPGRKQDGRAKLLFQLECSVKEPS